MIEQLTGKNALSASIRALERELARKEKALAEAARRSCKKTIASHYQVEDDDIDEPSGK